MIWWGRGPAWTLPRSTNVPTSVHSSPILLPTRESKWTPPFKQKTNLPPFFILAPPSLPPKKWTNVAFECPLRRDHFKRTISSSNHHSWGAITLSFRGSNLEEICINTLIRMVSDHHILQKRVIFVIHLPTEAVEISRLTHTMSKTSSYHPGI